MSDRSLVAAILTAGAIQNPNFEPTTENADKIVKFYNHLRYRLEHGDPVLHPENHGR